MQGQHCFQPEAVIELNLESFISPKHRLRKINKQIDFSFVRALTEKFYCPNQGRPSIDPEIFFRIILIGYLYHIPSDFRLCEEIHYNLAYRWFCKLNVNDKVPDHSSLTKIRDRLGLAIFKQFFTKILEQCKAKGLVKGEHVMTDGTLFQANASLDSLIPKDELKGEDKVITELNSPTRQPIRKISNQTHISRTDPQASLAFKKGTARTLKYKTHFTLDAASRVVLDAKVTTGATHESQVYLAQIEAIQNEFALTIQEATADRAYGSGDILQALRDKNITPNIPLFSRRSGRANVDNKYGFVYEREENRYRCPAGKYLLPYPAITNDTIHYRTQAKICPTCPLKDNCAAKIKSKTDIRWIRRNIYQDLFTHMTQQMQTAAFQAKLAERMWKVEGLISEAKQLHGLSRAKYRGLTKTQIQVYLIASVLNIKRLIFLLILLMLCATINDVISAIRLQMKSLS